MAMLSTVSHLHAMKRWVGTTGFSTSASAVNLTLADHGMVVSDFADAYLQTYEFDPQTDIWIHFEAWFNNTRTVNAPAIIGLSGGERVFGLTLLNGAAQSAVFLYNAGTPVEVSTASSISLNPRKRIDIKVKIAVAGEIIVYINESLVLLYLGDTTIYGFSNIDQFEFPSPGAGNDVFVVNSYTISQVIIANEDTRGLLLHSLRINGAGVINEWTSGSFADVDELNTLDAAFMQTSNPNNRVVFAMESIDALFNSHTVEALDMWALTEAINPAVPNYRCISRHPNTNVHPIGVQKIFPTFFAIGGQHCIAELNPDTGVAWTVSEINALEMGVESLP